MWTKRTVAVVATGGLLAAGVTGVAVAASTSNSGMTDDVISSLVQDGSVSSEDAAAFDRVRDQLQLEREERQAERQAQREEHMAAIAQAAGVSTEQLQERLHNGESLNDIAGENADAVASLLTTWAQERVAAAEQAIPERVEALMSREGFGFGAGMGREGRGFGGHHGKGGPGEGFGPGAGFGPGEGFGPGMGMGTDDAT